MMCLADIMPVFSLVMILQHQGGIVIFRRIHDALLQRLVELSPCHRGRHGSAALPEILLHLGGLGPNRHPLQIRGGLDRLLSVIVSDRGAPVGQDSEIVSGLLLHDLLHPRAELPVERGLPVLKALEKIVQREDIHLRDADPGHKARRDDDHIRGSHLELLHKLGLVLSKRPLVDRDRNFASGLLLHHLLELIHAKRIRILLRGLIRSDNQIQLRSAVRRGCLIRCAAAASPRASAGYEGCRCQDPRQ